MASFSVAGISFQPPLTSVHWESGSITRRAATLAVTPRPLQWRHERTPAANIQAVPESAFPLKNKKESWWKCTCLYAKMHHHDIHRGAACLVGVMLTQIYIRHFINWVTHAERWAAWSASPDTRLACEVPLRRSRALWALIKGLVRLAPVRLLSFSPPSN